MKREKLEFSLGHLFFNLKVLLLILRSMIYVDYFYIFNLMVLSILLPNPLFSVYSETFC